VELREGVSRNNPRPAARGEEWSVKGRWKERNAGTLLLTHGKCLLKSVPKMAEESWGGKACYLRPGQGAGMREELGWG
jgi:hypothetical protein